LRPEKWEASPDRAGSSHNDACGIGADRTVKPVFTVDQMKTVAIRHHVTTTVRQADEAGFQAGKLQAALQPGTSFASCKAKGDAFAPKLPQNAGNIDALAAKLAGFV